MNERPAVAYCIVPKSGGTYRYYRLLREAVEPLGWQVFGVCIGHEASAWDERFADDHCIHVKHAGHNLKSAAKAFADWVASNDVGIVVPMSSRVASSAIPHLPRDTRVLMRCSNITRHAYEIVVVHRRHVSSYIATSKRQHNDLVQKYHIESTAITLIPHAVDLAPFLRTEQAPSQQHKIRIAYLGRINHFDKGVFHIPPILRQLDALGVSFHLKIAGDGPDLSRLRELLDPWIAKKRVSCVGTLMHADVPKFLSTHDAFLMPSNFEGFGFTLIEAMAARCVPVASCIAGVTDWIVDHEKSGLLCPIGNARAFAKSLAWLQGHNEAKQSMAESARAAVVRRFDIPAFAASYDDLFTRVLASAPVRTPAGWREFNPSPAFRQGWRRFVPQRTKTWIRLLEERWKGTRPLMKG